MTIDELNILLQYCTYCKGIFTPFQRIMINQQRGNILTYDNPYVEVPLTVFTKDLRYKILANLKIIKSTNWLPKKMISMNWDFENL